MIGKIGLELNLKLFCDPLYKNNPLKSKGGLGGLIPIFLRIGSATLN